VGAKIIAAITSGLGLITSIGGEFMSGFEVLVWDASANSGAGDLTSFGNFAFVLVGVAVSFSVIKLILNLLRGNTGV